MLEYVVGQAGGLVVDPVVFYTDGRDGLRESVCEVVYCQKLMMPRDR